MAEPKVWVFFYGSYMNLGVLREVDLVPERWEVGRLGGFDIQIRPRANLIRSDRDSVYGIATTASHAELARLYAHARDVLGEVYLPEAVLVQLPVGPLAAMPLLHLPRHGSAAGRLRLCRTHRRTGARIRFPDVVHRPVGEFSLLSIG